MKIDWLEYFREFSLMHGGNPIEHRKNPDVRKSGFLLFPDGWMYSASNVTGPEYPPPIDKEEHIKLIRKYWTVRKEAWEVEYSRCKEVIRDTVATQRARSASLQTQVSIDMEDENGNRTRRREVHSIDFKDMLDRLRVISEEIKVCVSNLSSVIIPDNGHAEFSPASILAELEEIDSERVR